MEERQQNRVKTDLQWQSQVCSGSYCNTVHFRYFKDSSFGKLWIPVLQYPAFLELVYYSVLSAIASSPNQAVSYAARLLMHELIRNSILSWAQRVNKTKQTLRISCCHQASTKTKKKSFLHCQNLLENGCGISQSHKWFSLECGIIHSSGRVP